jgi:hypothetical protein
MIYIVDFNLGLENPQNRILCLKWVGHGAKGGEDWHYKSRYESLNKNIIGDFKLSCLRIPFLTTVYAMHEKIGELLFLYQDSVYLKNELLGWQQFCENRNSHGTSRTWKHGLTKG